MSDITKRAISASLKKLLLTKSLNKITIQDITDDCGINRQTFYYHFADIYDLVEWTCIEDAEKVLKENKTYDTWQEGFLAVFVLAKKDKAFIDNIYRSVSLEMLEQYLYRLVCQTRIIRTLQKRRYLCAFLQILGRCTYSTTVLTFATNHQKYRRFR